ncbi:MBG domain-containing protein, partial [Labilibaculum euxinus]
LSRATGEDVGSYAITIGTLSAGSNYDLTFVSKDFSITQKAITVTVDAGQTKVYGGADPTFTYTASAALESDDSFSGFLSRSIGEAVGSYAITIGTLSAGSNYDLTFVSKDFSITQKAITVTVDAGQTKVYGGADPTFTYTTSSALESGDSFSGVLSRTSGESVGSYAITIGTLSAGSNYDLTFVSKDFSITQKAITVTADAGQTKVYGDADPTFTYTTSAALESGDSFTGVLSRTSGESVGSYAILQGTLSAGLNYDLTFVSKDFSITQKSLTVTAENKTKEYDGAVFTGFTVTYSGFITGEDETDLSGTLVYSGSATTATNVGTGYVITPGGLTSSNYAITFADGSLDITLKVLTITAEDKSKEYDGAVYSGFTVTYAGFRIGEDETDLSGTLTFTGTASTAINVGTGYVITPGGLTSSNYHIIFADGSLDITQKAITVTADAGQTKVYGDADPTFTYTASSALESGDSFSGVLSRTSGESVGSYAILQGTLSAGSNYDLTFVSKDFSITQKAITVTADAGQTKVYGDADPAFTYTASSALESGDSFSGVLSRATGEDVGSYAITIGTLSAGSNYDLTFVSKDFSITQKSLTVTAENKTKEYDGAVFTGFTVTYAGFISGEDETDLSGTLAFTGTASTAINVGTGYVITPGGLTSSNYAITFADGSLDITIASQIIIFNPLGTKVYGDAPFTISATGGISGNPVVFISSDQNVAVCSGVNGEIVNIIGVGTCMINANQAGNSNFNPAIQVSQILTVNKYIAGDTDGDGVITDPEIAGDTDGDGVITDPELAGDTNGDGIITDPEIAGDTDGDGVITDPEIAGDTDGNGTIDDSELAGDTDGDGVITDPEIAGDTDGDGVITDPEIAGDTDGDGVITDPEIAGDTDGDGIITDPEIAGDTDGDGVITDPEIAGDTNGDGIITDPEIAGDTDGDGVITDPEIAGDTDGDGVITDPEIAGDTDGDGVITDPEIAGDTDGNGTIDDSELAGDTDGDGVITDPEIAGDTDGDGVITDPEIAGDTDGDGVITDPEIAGDTNGDGVIDDSESTEITLDLVNDVDNPLSLCDDTEVELAYTGLIGNPSQYRITFEESASTAGFHDIDYTDILSDSRVFRFSVPVGVPDGLYEGNLQLRNNFGVESVMYKFQFIVNVSAEYIISKYDDVVLCDNSSERFAAYQWYKDGVAIPGAVNQFYNDPDGLVGSYSLDLITIDGQHLTTCSKEFNIPLNKSISVYPNPISSNGKCTVRMNGFEEDELLGSQLSIFNSFGAKVFYTEDVIKENVLLLQLKNGVYVGNVTTETGSKYSFKILIQK